MTKQFICDLQEGDRVNSVFLIKARRLMDFRKKPGRYLSLVLADRSGEIEARVWEDGEKAFAMCQRSKIMAVTGEVVAFGDQLQMRVTGLCLPAPDEYDLAFFVGTASRPLEEMSRDLQQLVASISSQSWRDVGWAVVESEWYPDYCRAPAARLYHHNYIGGLLEHTLGVARIALGVAEIYGGIDRNLLIIGALLHDVGKVKEFTFNPGIEYTDEGKLLGHIVLGLQMADELMARAGSVSPEQRQQLLHMITSHHGEYEWQSPKRPKFVEAKILHLADMMDAEVFKFQVARPIDEGEHWSPYIREIGNQVYLWERSSIGGDGNGDQK
ncbi:MAG: HD domain-containing protein [Syntrophomonadaceae bacterium]|jgi:3'-5' exoribonuclease|nr:HD domain-containing protein [Syntrophomonadaceae bacterium]